MRNKLSNLIKAFAICALAPIGMSTLALVTTGPAQANSPEYCEAYARDEADRRSGTVRSAARGGLVGGILDGEDGAIRGATVGAVRGLIGNEGRRYKRYYNQAYDRCMRG